MHIPVRSVWLPVYINVVQTVLVILTMVGLFLDRPHTMGYHSARIDEILPLATWVDLENIILSEICLLYTSDAADDC